MKIVFFFIVKGNGLRLVVEMDKVKTGSLPETIPEMFQFHNDNLYNLKQYIPAQRIECLLVKRNPTVVHF